MSLKEQSSLQLSYEGFWPETSTLSFSPVLLRRRLRLAAVWLSLVGAMLALAFAFESLTSKAICVIGCVGTLGTNFYLGARPIKSVYWLRMIERVLFGFAAVQAISLQVTLTIRYGQDVAPGETPLVTVAFFGGWGYLILLYGMLVPNTIKRALIVCTVACAIPIATFAGLAVFLEIEPTQSEKFIVGLTAAFLLLTALTAALGLARIRQFADSLQGLQEINGYRLIEQIGSGGMGMVYLAEHRVMRRLSALKLVREDRDRDGRMAARFEEEVRQTARLTDPHIIQIYEYGHDVEGRFFYAMEYLLGHDVQEIVRRFGPMPHERAMFLFGQVARALASAHSALVVHQDIKPSNIFLTQCGGDFDFVKVLDFGLASRRGELRMSSSLAGTPSYMAPEQFSPDGHVDPRSDIYAAAAATLFMLTGFHPETSSGTHKWSRKQAAKSIKNQLQVAARRTPSESIRVLRDCLAFDPKARIQTAKELRKAIRSASCPDAWDHDIARDWWEGIAERVDGKDIPRPKMAGALSADQDLIGATSPTVEMDR
ncbi:serine/threonine protein kinase [Stratiformator vulcanicus]|uniref:Serine/threonine-protein kinase PknH n=1 Tax=Stratiformator vulcanicus TaxID=2527980 RepID=A0A517R0M3_9PLAN|nr:serine/threonine-protein kinase [Stratiformator vulcanicus]QDT37439.1 Serine/threonine-protein kinase PknH [Stratiformator vulcanicus]